MKIYLAKLVKASAACISAALVQSSFAAAFVQGSAINVPVGQTLPLEMPSNGVFNCSTVFVGRNAELQFIQNPLNTPVFLVVTGDVTVSGGRITLDGSPQSGTLGGAGGPGGFSGGMGGITGGHSVGGDGRGPGGGKNASERFGGVFASAFRSNTNDYGNALLYPLIGGSGGAGLNNNGGGGSGGGGAILIASGTRIVINNDSYSGYISAVGGYGGNVGGAGSGGAIRLVAPSVTGTGYLNVNGGSDGYSRGGSQGRIRIDCRDDFAYRTLTYYGSFTRGSQMFVFPSNPSRLDVVEAAGQSVALGITNAVTVSLPFGAPTNQVVKLRAENFTNNVPVRIAVTPDTGPSITFDGVITNTGSPTVTDFNVVIPVGTISRVDAWTR